jgi:hypothetical protein
MKQTKFWAILFSALFIVGCGVFLLLKYTGGEGTVADIRVDGELYETIDLNAVTIPYDIRVESQYGYNIVHVEHGAISVTDSDCPDHICMAQGRITGPGIPIVCMPHRLVIEIRGEP